MSDICKRCNGTGSMEKCLRCGREYRHIHKYSDCDGPDCDGEAAKTIPCSDCAGTGKQAGLAADPLPDHVIAEWVELLEKDQAQINLTMAELHKIHRAHHHYPAALREVQSLRAEVKRLRAWVRQTLKQHICDDCEQYVNLAFGRPEWDQFVKLLTEEPDHA